MLFIRADEAAPIELRVQGWGKRGQFGQDQISQAERVGCGQACLANSIHALEGAGQFLHPLLHGLWLKPGSHIPL